MVRRKKTSMFFDAKETTTVHELKRMIEGLLKIAPDDQQLWRDDQIMEDKKSLAEYGLTSTTARAQTPASIGLAARNEDGEFEQLDITALSSPPELPDVMRSQDAAPPQAQQEAVVSN